MAATTIAATLSKLAKVPTVEVRKPPSKKALAALEAEAGPLPPGLVDYFQCCDGVSWVDGLELFSVKQMMAVDSPGFFVIADDGCGDYDLVAARFQPGLGSVVFWDHETATTDYLRASSVAAYLKLWAMRVLAGASDKPDPTLGKWPHDAAFMAKHDPGFAELERSRTFEKQLGKLEIEHVQRKGAKPRQGVNPFTGEPMTIPAPPTKRRR